MRTGVWNGAVVAPVLQMDSEVMAICCFVKLLVSLPDYFIILKLIMTSLYHKL